MLSSLKLSFQEVTKEVFKEAGKKVRREIDNWTTFRPSMSEDASDCLEDHRGQPMKKLADLRLVVKKCKGLAANDDVDTPIDSYVVVQVEAATKSTAVIFRELDPVFDAAMNFTVRNLSADISIQVINNNNRNRLIGQALVPIASLLPRLEPSEMHCSREGSIAGSVPSRLKTTLELELYPLPKDATKFQQVPLELRRDVKGLARPEERLGSVELEVTLQLRRPLLETYFSASMPGPLSRRAALRIASGQDADEDDVDFTLLRWNALRIRDALLTPPSWLALVTHLRSWRQPWLSLLAMILLSGVAATAELWQTPMLLSGSMLLLGKYSAASRRAREASVTPWQQEIPPKPAPKPGEKPLVLKALKGKQFLIKAQRDTGRAAAFLERLRNALNWSDPNPSMVLAAVIAVAGALLSLLCLAIQILLSVIPTRLIIISTIVQVLLPPSVQEAFYRSRMEMLGPTIEDVSLAITLSLSLSPGGGDDEDDTLAIDAAKREEDLKPLGRGILAFARLCASVPDQLEMTHRIITRQQNREPQIRERRTEVIETDSEEHEDDGGEEGPPGGRPLVLRGNEAARREEEGDRLVAEVLEEIGAGGGSPAPSVASSRGRMTFAVPESRPVYRRSMTWSPTIWST